MPDLQNFTLTQTGMKNLRTPEFRIEATIIDDTVDPPVTRDFTGANAVLFPQELENRTQAQRNEIIENIAIMLLYMKAGMRI